MEIRVQARGGAAAAGVAPQEGSEKASCGVWMSAGGLKRRENVCSSRRFSSQMSAGCGIEC